jgi:predicted ATP-dependent serine protease
VAAFTGDAGSGKSTLLTAWARNAWRDSGIPSLFLDRENPISVIADRLQRLEMEDGPGMKFWGGWLPQEAPQPDSPIVRAWAKEHRGIVVIDSFSAFLDGDQNDANTVRGFLHRCRRLADLRATPCVIHHDGKAETARDYRGSSDFKAAIDVGFHVSNFGNGGLLDRLVLRPFKNRFGLSHELSYRYADGKFIRGDATEATQTLAEQLTALLRLNPGVTARRFDELVRNRGISRMCAYDRAGC